MGGQRCGGAIDGRWVAVYRSGLRHVPKHEGPNDFNGTGTSNWDVVPDGEQFVYIAQTGRSRAGLVWIMNWPEVVRGMASGN